MKNVLATFLATMVALMTMGAGKAASKGDLDLRFSTLALPGSEVADLYYDHAGENVKLTVSSDSRLAYYPYRGPATLTLYRLGAAENGQEKRIPAAEVNLEDSGPNPLLLFLPSSGEDLGRLRVRPVPDDLKNFPLGTFEFMNTTGATVEITVGGESIHLESDQFQVITPHLAPGATTLLLQVHRANGDGKELLSSGNWSFSSKSRTVAIVGGDSGSGVRVARMTDLGPPPLAEAKNRPVKAKR